MEEERSHCPFRAGTHGRGVLTEAQARQVEDKARLDIADAVEYARTAPDPALESLYDGVYVE